MATEPDFIPRSDGNLIDDLKARMHKNGELVRAHLCIAANAMKTRYDARNKSEFNFSEDLLFTGPFKIVKFVGMVNVVIRRSRRQKPFVVHRDKLWPASESNESSNQSPKDEPITRIWSKVAERMIDSGPGDNETVSKRSKHAIVGPVGPTTS